MFSVSRFPFALLMANARHRDLNSRGYASSELCEPSSLGSSCTSSLASLSSSAAVEVTRSSAVFV